MSTSLHSSDDSGRLSGLVGAWIGKIIFVLVVAVVVAGAIYLLGWSKLEVSSGIVGPLVSLFVAALFALAPLLACFAHTISIDRQIEKLDACLSG